MNLFVKGGTADEEKRRERGREGGRGEGEGRRERGKEGGRGNEGGRREEREGREEGEWRRGGGKEGGRKEGGRREGRSVLLGRGTARAAMAVLFLGLPLYFCSSKRLSSSFVEKLQIFMNAISHIGFSFCVIKLSQFYEFHCFCIFTFTVARTQSG